MSREGRGRPHRGARAAEDLQDEKIKTRVPQLADAALVYVKAGWPVFPCEPGGKAPIGRLAPHGFKDATTDVATIRRWWTSEPEANIGTPTGVFFDVLDVDVRLDGDGFAALRRLGRAGLLAGAFAEAETRNGGKHLFFPTSGSGCRSFPRHRIDIKAAGGYVLLAPSTVAADEGVDGPGRYKWLNFDHVRDPKPLDVEAISNRLDPPRLQRPQPKRTPGRRGNDGDQLVKWLERQGEGNRNAGLFWASKRAAVLGLLDDDLHRSLTDTAVRLGLTEREATATIKSGMRHGTNGGAA
ncbi:MAG: bifunctional DNA primase/polymerase [Actinobacteria bacterium]|nr:bifunctional DNA primase/polymerase [Actinomycetota bacterium]